MECICQEALNLWEDGLLLTVVWSCGSRMTLVNVCTLLFVNKEKRHRHTCVEMKVKREEK